jgi:hypothetical protein
VPEKRPSLNVLQRIFYQVGFAGSIPDRLAPIECKNGRVILAKSQVTGHAHAIELRGAALFRDSQLAALFMTVAGNPVARSMTSTTPS